MRKRIFFKLLSGLGVREGEIMPAWAKLIFSIIFPVTAMNSRLLKYWGLDTWSMTLSIGGMKWGYNCLYMMGEDIGTYYRIDKKDNGVICFTRIHPDDIILKVSDGNQGL